MKYKCLLALLVALPSYAQKPTSAHMLGFGNSRVLDTYINQERFSGSGFTYLNLREREQPVKKWNNVIEHEIDFSSTHDRSDNYTMLEADYNLYWGRYRQWQLMDKRLLLQAGGLMNLNAGFLYDMTTSNNPAQARASIGVMPSAIAAYRFKLFRQSFVARYEVNLPLAGLMFSPNYGQSYYEIFNRGNYDHNLVLTSFVSAPTWRQQASVDWQMTQRYALRLGYLGNYMQAEVNHLKQHVYAHRLMIGIVVKK